jgi:hydrogenase maturation protein HypF
MKSRIHIVIRGAVQGIGFRPFVYRLANELKLNGYVFNNSKGVFIEAEGDEKILNTFLSRIEKEKPSLSVITSLEHSILDPADYNDFTIRESEEDEDVSALILPDIAVCDDCLNEMFNPDDRRYLYPFINCTNCGPRFSIIESIPYDRPNTSMKIFKMCDACREEYENPLDRRFHAQPTACHDCGPQVSLWNEKGNRISIKNEAIVQSTKLIKDGKIIALKGIGGFQLIVDAQNNDTIKRLRKRKHREEKPFALLFPAIQSIKNVCHISKTEERVLRSPESPIVLLKKKSASLLNGKQVQNSKLNISDFVAPSNPYLGVMLPYTPLHHLLMREFNSPIVATSANLSEEPICIDENEALERLKGITDYFLVNNRPIVRHVDDSIVRIVMNREMVLRRARGYAPLPVQLRENYGDSKFKTILAVGGHLKNTVALKKGDSIFISQHIGDLSTEESNNTFKKVIKDFELLYDAKPDNIISDMHPDYISTKHAKLIKSNVEQVQHHYAHIAACRLENQIDGQTLGASWDGTGYGEDGTIWGGEFFLTDDSSYKHVARLKQFKLPGGEIAIKEPRRSLAGIFFELSGEFFVDEYGYLLKKKFADKDLSVIANMLVKGINSPLTSSAGRLFDAVSSLLGICQKSSYEGQAAMMLEFTADRYEMGDYPFKVIEDDKLIINWQPLIENIILDLKKDVATSIISAKFHNSLAKIILSIAKIMATKKVILSGGCFQNGLLLERTIELLQVNKYKVYWHQRIPPNDGGISLGQIAAYLIEHSHQILNVKENNKETQIMPEGEQVTKEVS